jgi:DNA polymerase III delta subunit
VAASTPAAVRRQIASGEADPVYLVQGQDDIEKAALAGEFAALVDEGLQGFNVQHIHAGDVGAADRLLARVSEVVDAARTLPMLSSRRIVIVHEAEDLLAPRRGETEAAKQAVAEIEAYLARPEPMAVLVFVAGSIDKRSRIYKQLQKSATLVECGVIDNRADAERWIRNRVAAAGADIEPQAARLMVDLAGFDDKAQRSKGDLARLRSEVDRLLLYALGQPRITVADVRELAGPQALKDDWAMTNAIEGGNAAEALRQLALVLDAGAAPEQLLGQLGWVVRAKFPDIAPDTLAAAIESLFRTDQELKRANRSSDQPRILLERLVVELCAGPRDRSGRAGGWR